jgi:hypothetical protein
MGQKQSGSACAKQRKAYEDAKGAYDFAKAVWDQKYGGEKKKKNLNDSLRDAKKVEALKKDMLAKKSNLEACENEFELH